MERRANAGQRRPETGIAMARNGIAISVDPKLGKTSAGLIWLPVPESGMPEWMLQLERKGCHGELWHPIRDALCEEHRGGATGVHPIAVSDATWTAVESFAEDLRTKMEAEAAKTAAANAECDALIAEYEAAIANPEPSRLLTRSDAPWGHAWDCKYDSTPGSDLEHKTALDHARGAAQSEAMRRSKENAVAFADRASDDEFMAAFDFFAAQKFDLLERRSRIEKARNEATKAANQAAIRTALAGAPAHIVERWEAGRLPESELKSALASALFGAIDLQRYEKIEDSEVEHDENCSDPEIKVKACEYDGELDAEEWESWKAAKAAIEAAGFEAELRQVTAYCTDDDCSGSVSRLQARVEAEVGGVTVIRAYAVG